MTDDLITWLRAQIDEDEGRARTAFAEHNDAIAEWREPWSGSVEIGPHEDDLLCNDSGVSRHIVNWDPARVLAEVDAKRRIIDLADHHARRAREDREAGDPSRAVETIRDTLHAVLMDLALPYVGRPGYRQEWAP